MDRLFHGDCVDLLDGERREYDCIFADPPDNIKLGYGEYADNMPDEQYVELLGGWVSTFAYYAKTAWISFNAKWTVEMGAHVKDIMDENPTLKCKPCVQVFTFGQHNKFDFGNNHRPLWRLQWGDEAEFNADEIKVKSWRQLNGDKRAAKGGRVPGDVIPTFTETDDQLMLILNAIDAEEVYPGDVMDFPRVTGNSKQRRSWHPTQLHEAMVERCVRSCTKEGGTVMDPFAGTGTTARVCKRIGRTVTTCDVDRNYCAAIAEELGMKISEIPT
ncbi:MAG: DNA-methyltransferase [Planctomycetota bacterium]|jgi:DNA modification methylase